MLPKKNLSNYCFVHMGLHRFTIDTYKSIQKANTMSDTRGSMDSSSQHTRMTIYTIGRIRYVRYVSDVGMSVRMKIGTRDKRRGKIKCKNWIVKVNVCKSKILIHYGY